MGTRPLVAVKMSCLIVFVVVAAQFANGASDQDPTTNIHLEASPSQIHEGYTSHLILNCSLPPHPSSDKGTLMSIIISKAPEPLEDDVPSSQVFTEIAAISSTSPQNITLKNSLGATVSGQLFDNGLSFLALDWSYPGDDVIGLYKCQYYGMDSIGHPRLGTAMQGIADKAVDFDDILTKMKNMDLAQKAQVALFQNQLDAQREQIQNLTSQLGDAWSAMFVKSATFQGHEYFLSRASVWDIAAHQTACRAFGGYLVEIDDAQEHNFIKTFAQNHKHVLVGMTDEEKEGRWIHLQSQQPVTYFDWAPSQPNNAGGNDDCVFLACTGDCKMVDSHCQIPTLMSVFVCEKPL